MTEKAYLNAILKNNDNLNNRENNKPIGEDKNGEEEGEGEVEAQSSESVREDKVELQHNNLCEEDNILTNIICLTLTKPYIFRTYTIPDFKLYLHNFDTVLEKHLSIKSDITIMNKHNLVKFGDVNYFILGDVNFDTKQLQAAMLQVANDLLLQNRTMNPMNYFANIPGFQIAKAGVNSLNKLPKLFDGIHFYFDNLKLQEIGDVQYVPDDIKSLILLGGGKVDTRSPTSFSRETYYPYHSDKSSNSAATNYYLLHHESKNFKKKIYYNETKYRTVEWLINCINNFKILPE
ncbi:hypothetical protein FQA39_LY14130 [Lamprigera yunnana]|nr:hypothetical protein FQA39_LY14130 [Lamprigera yunnana]